MVVSLQASFALDPVTTIDETQSIQNDGINATEDKGTLILNPGTYYQYNMVIDRNITIQGNGPANTVTIDAKKLGRIFTINNNVNVTFINITFLNGTSSADGGAIYNKYANSTITFINCSFIKNQLSGFGYGGAIWNNGTLRVVDCNFTSNVGGFHGGGIANYGYLSVSGSNFTKNSAGASGAIFNSGHMNVSDSYFNGNSGGGAAGAIGTYTGSMNVTGCYFIKNRANYGGAVYSSGNAITSVIGNYFINNSADTEGWAIYIESNSDVVVQYNCFVNHTGSSGYLIGSGGTGRILADFNWWGSNDANPFAVVNNSKVIINNYYTMFFNSTDTGTKFVGDNFIANYYFVLNGTNDPGEFYKFYNFKTIITYNDDIIQIINAKESQTVIIPLTVAGDAIIKATTDNEIQSLSQNPIAVGESQKDDKSGDNAGDNTGGNTGGNTGDNAGGNTGGKTGGNTGDNAGDHEIIVASADFSNDNHDDYPKCNNNSGINNGTNNTNVTHAHSTHHASATMKKTGIPIVEFILLELGISMLVFARTKR